MIKIISSISIFILFNGYAQTFDNSFSYGAGSTLLRPTLIEETSDSEFIGIGDSLLMKIDSNGVILWVKKIPCENPRSLKLDSDDNIYYTYQSTDSNGYIFSRMIKVNPDGYQIWSFDAGSGYEEVLYNGLHVQDLYYFYAVGQMKTDSVWHNIITKFNYLGNEEWSRRIFQSQGSSNNQIPDTTTLLKIDQAPNGLLYILGQINNNVLLYRFSPEGSLSGFKRYDYKDSLIAIDIVASGGSDIQVLAETYNYFNHFTRKTCVKMQIDYDLQTLNATEYSQASTIFNGIGLKVNYDRCFMMINTSNGSSSTLIEKTNLAGGHVLSRITQEQDSSQFGHDFVLRADNSLVIDYSFGMNSTHVLSGTNQEMQSNCDLQYGASIQIDTITISDFTATGLTMSLAWPQFNTSPYNYLVIDSVNMISTCTGTVSISEDLNNIIVYPNPAAFEIFINITPTIAYRTTLIDMEGRIVISAQNMDSIDIRELESGMYILLIEFNNTSLKKRISIIH